MKKPNPLQPSATLLIRLGSAMIHAQELIESEYKHADFDVPAFWTAANDPEVREWVKAMGPMLPSKRASR